jgi:hypothetical protein
VAYDDYSDDDTWQSSPVAYRPPPDDLGTFDVAAIAPEDQQLYDIAAFVQPQPLSQPPPAVANWWETDEWQPSTAQPPQPSPPPSADSDQAWWDQGKPYQAQQAAPTAGAPPSAAPSDDDQAWWDRGKPYDPTAAARPPSDRWWESDEWQPYDPVKAARMAAGRSGPSTDQDSDWFSPFLRSFASSVPEAVVGGVGGMAISGAVGQLALPIPGVGFAAGLVGGGALAYGAHKVVQGVESLVGYDGDKQAAIDAQQHPIATTAGELASMAVPFGVGGRGLSWAQRGFQGLLGGGIEAGGQLAAGQDPTDPYNLARTAASAGTAAVLANPRSWVSQAERGAAAQVARATGTPLRPQYRPVVQKPGGTSEPVTPSTAGDDTTASTYHGTPGAEAAAGTAEAKAPPVGDASTGDTSYSKATLEAELARVRQAQTTFATDQTLVDPDVDAAIKASQRYLKFQPPRAACSSFCVGYPRMVRVPRVFRSTKMNAAPSMR